LIGGFFLTGEFFVIAWLFLIGWFFVIAWFFVIGYTWVSEHHAFAVAGVEQASFSCGGERITGGGGRFGLFSPDS